jgi:hypothetical protein
MGTPGDGAETEAEIVFLGNEKGPTWLENGYLTTINGELMDLYGI